MKPTKEQFEAFVEVQMTGITNMWHSVRVIDLALERSGVELTEANCIYIIAHYAELKKEYGDAS